MGVHGSNLSDMSWGKRRRWHPYRFHARLGEGLVTGVGQRGCFHYVGNDAPDYTMAKPTEETARVHVFREITFGKAWWLHAGHGIDSRTAPCVASPYHLPIPHHKSTKKPRDTRPHGENMTETHIYGVSPILSLLMLRLGSSYSSGEGGSYGGIRKQST